MNNVHKTTEITYGPALNAVQIKAFIKALAFKEQTDLPAICIWGQHGIGKSELAHEIAKEWGWPLVYCSPAQFEEMGDLTGLPYLKDQNNGQKQSQLAPPAWIPQQDGPGILLMDDFNRADDRILRGIMPLLLQKEMVSWSLPKNWIIILTANPDGSNYAVTPVDDALLSRMLHLHMVFDAKSWALWAEKQGLPGQGIDFMLQHPALIQGQRTTPRTITWFLNLWQKAGLPSVDQPILKQLAQSCLEASVAEAFIQFSQTNKAPLPAPEAIINEAETNDTLLNLHQNNQLDADRLYQLMTRLSNYLTLNPFELNIDQLKNLTTFLLSKYTPAEQSLLFLRALSRIEHPALEQLSKNREIVKLLVV